MFILFRWSFGKILLLFMNLIAVTCARSSKSCLVFLQTLVGSRGPIVIWRWFAQRGGTRCQLAPSDICFSSQFSSFQFVLLRNMRKKSRECRSIQNKTNDIFLLKKDLKISNKVLFALLFIIVYLFILTFSHTQRDFCFYCLQLNLTAGTNELALIKGGGLSFSLKKRGS